MTYKDKVCPVCEEPFKDHVVTLHGSEFVECLLEALDMEVSELKTITEHKEGGSQ